MSHNEEKIFLFRGASKGLSSYKILKSKKNPTKQLFPEDFFEGTPTSNSSELKNKKDQPLKLTHPRLLTRPTTTKEHKKISFAQPQIIEENDVEESLNFQNLEKFNNDPNINSPLLKAEHKLTIDVELANEEIPTTNNTSNNSIHSKKNSKSKIINDCYDINNDEFCEFNNNNNYDGGVDSQRKNFCCIDNIKYEYQKNLSKNYFNSTQEQKFITTVNNEKFPSIQQDYYSNINNNTIIPKFKSKKLYDIDMLKTDINNNYNDVNNNLNINDNNEEDVEYLPLQTEPKNHHFYNNNKNINEKVIRKNSNNIVINNYVKSKSNNNPLSTNKITRPKTTRFNTINERGGSVRKMKSSNNVNIHNNLNKINDENNNNNANNKGMNNKRKAFYSKDKINLNTKTRNNFPKIYQKTMVKKELTNLMNIVNDDYLEDPEINKRFKNLLSNINEFKEVIKKKIHTEIRDGLNDKKCNNNNNIKSKKSSYLC